MNECKDLLCDSVNIVEMVTNIMSLPTELVSAIGSHLAYEDRRRCHDAHPVFASVSQEFKAHFWKLEGQYHGGMLQKKASLLMHRKPLLNELKLHVGCTFLSEAEPCDVSHFVADLQQIATTTLQGCDINVNVDNNATVLAALLHAGVRIHTAIFLDAAALLHVAGLLVTGLDNSSIVDLTVLQVVDSQTVGQVATALSDAGVGRLLGCAASIALRVGMIWDGEDASARAIADVLESHPCVELTLLAPLTPVNAATWFVRAATRIDDRSVCIPGSEDHIRTLQSSCLAGRLHFLGTSDLNPAVMLAYDGMLMAFIQMLRTIGVERLFLWGKALSGPAVVQFVDVLLDEVPRLHVTISEGPSGMPDTAKLCARIAAKVALRELRHHGDRVKADVLPCDICGCNNGASVQDMLAAARASRDTGWTQAWRMWTAITSAV